MSTPRAGQPGATRLCPHCKATVLESASICPGCRHHLRFSGGKQLAEESYTALSVDGTIVHQQAVEPCEYCIVLDISNERGEQVMRQVVGVGALQVGEQRRLNLSVQMLPLVAQAQPRAAVSPPASAAAATPAVRPSLGRPASPAAIPVAANAAPPGGAASPSAAANAAAAAAAAGRPRPAGSPGAVSGGSGLGSAPGARTPGTPVPGQRAPTPPAGGVKAPTAPSASPASPLGAPSAPSSPGLTQSQRLRIFRKP